MHCAIFGTFGSVAGIVTSVALGYTMQSMDYFSGALI